MRWERVGGGGVLKKPRGAFGYTKDISTIKPGVLLNYYCFHHCLSKL